MTDMEKLVVAVTELRAAIGATKGLNRKVYRATKRVGKALRKHGIKEFDSFQGDEHRGSIYIRRNGALKGDTLGFGEWIHSSWMTATARHLPEWLSRMAASKGKTLVSRDETARKLACIADALEKA